MRVPVGVRLLPARIFYGWWIAAACGALMFVGVGVGYYGLAVFLRPLQEAHGWSNSVVSGATGLYFAVVGIAGVVVGPIIDRRGPRQLMLSGSILLGLAVAAVGFVTAPWQLYAVYTVLAVAVGMSASVGINAVLSRWFSVHRAKAFSITATGVSLGGVVLAPLGSTLIGHGGLALASVVMGALVVAVAVPAIVLVVVWDPQELGLHPDGAAAPPVPSLGREALSDEVQRRTWSRREAISTGSFWAVLVSFVLILAAQTGFILHQLSFLQGRFGSSSRAALALSTTAFGSIVARLVVGMFADRFDKRLLTTVLFVVQGTAVLGVVATDNLFGTYVLVLVIGFTIGNIYMMQTLLVGEIFGVVSFGTVFGLLSLATQVGSGLGPFAVGWLEDLTGSYTAPFVLTALASFVAAAVVPLARPVRKSEPQTTSGASWNQ